MLGVAPGVASSFSPCFGFCFAVFPPQRNKTILNNPFSKVQFFKRGGVGFGSAEAGG